MQLQDYDNAVQLTHPHYVVFRPTERLYELRHFDHALCIALFVSYMKTYKRIAAYRLFPALHTAVGGRLISPPISAPPRAPPA